MSRKSRSSGACSPWALIRAATVLWAVSVCAGVLRCEASETNSEITLTFNNLTNYSILPKLSQVSGTAVSANVALHGIAVRLRDLESGDWWNWEQASWSEDRTGNQKTVPVTDNLNWKTPLPRLASGRYEISVQAVIVSKVGKGTFNWPVATRRAFIIDSRPPGINFFPLHDQQTVFDFSEIGGEIDKDARIQLSISRVNELSELNRYWNGANWQTNADAQIKLGVSSAGDFWFPSAETRLPKASEIPPGMYLISVSAIDRAGNEGRAAITVIKVGPSFTLKQQRQRIFTEGSKGNEE